MAPTPLLGPEDQNGTRRKHRLGFPLLTRIKVRFLRKRRGYFPRPPQWRNQCLMISSGPVCPRALESLGPNGRPFFKELKCFPNLLSPEKIKDSFQFLRRIKIDFDSAPFFSPQNPYPGSQGSLEFLNQRLPFGGAF
jgi:hypothetical protein